MRRLMLTLFFGFIPLGGLLSHAEAADHHIILCGGPAQLKWEKLRIKPHRHDRWWANFIRASTLRMVEIRKVWGSGANITWIVYQPGYQLRSQEDQKPYVTWINDLARKRNVNLVWINSGTEAISAINKHPSRSVVTFDYFGHSNRHCFMIDYGSEIMAACKAWVHESQIKNIRRSIFKPTALCQSYGCHTASSMSPVFKKHTGITLIATHGKSDYIPVGQGKMPTGSWVR